MAEKESQTYEKMLKDVDGIITEISSDKASLDEVVGKVEHAYDLITKMRERLDSSKEKIDKLRSDFQKA